MQVDLIVLSRDLDPLRDDVRAGIDAQAGVSLTVHRLAGTVEPGDPNRWATIVRARNRCRGLGTHPFVMLLDDDVVLDADCVSRLLRGLLARPHFAALAADTAGVMNSGWEHWDYPSHVGMAAILFRRERLAELTFRWEPGRCECLCCAADLRSRGIAIGYQPGALGWHRPIAHSQPASPEGTESKPATRSQSLPRQSAPPRVEGRILSAFDRRDHVRFRNQFLRSLRASGNQERVWAFAYGLYPTELAQLAAEPGVEVVSVPHDGVCPALRRLRDFRPLIESWPENTPVAYWDAGDVLFQGRLESLWNTVAASPGILHVVAEPLSYPENLVISYWCSFIKDPESRKRALDVMTTNVFLNSGFAAGTAEALLSYLQEGERLLSSKALAGVGDWGDQPALNLYAHTHPDRWRLMDPCWNYALAGRPRSQFQILETGQARRSDGGPLCVLHGNAATLRWLELMPPASRQA